jgi:hypothetical protein
MENFSVLLGKLAKNGRNPDLDGPAFRVSTKVAEVMLSLGAALARNASYSRILVTAVGVQAAALG